MSCEPSIRLSGVGKTYRIHTHPAARLAAAVSSRYAGEPFEALAGVDLVARRGECIGIVGRNGAGKSTLLQIVSGVMAPTTGTVETRGRIAAMLQLGAGFNGEFTGRQNVRLSAAIYGLGPREIEARMASIEAFAGIGAKIDRPVREYSSGMFARLAFAVCAHVDPAILIVDEILGVGDADFQQRSMRFLRQFRRTGIVLFVSHDEHAVSALCNRAVWIDAGRILADGPARPVLRRYRQHMAALAAGAEGRPAGGILQGNETRGMIAETQVEPASAFDLDDLPASAGGAVIRDISISSDNMTRGAFAGGEAVTIEVSATAASGLEGVSVLAFVRNPMGQVVFELDSRRFAAEPGGNASAGDAVDCRFRFLLPFLPTGVYPVDALVLSSGKGGTRLEAVREGTATIRVVSSHVSGGLANIQMDHVSFDGTPQGKSP